MENTFSDNTKKSLIGKVITLVGDDYIVFDNGITIYIDNHNEIGHFNEMFNEVTPKTK